MAEGISFCFSKEEIKMMSLSLCLKPKRARRIEKLFFLALFCCFRRYSFRLFPLLSMTSLLFKNGQIVTENGLLAADVLIKNERITQIASSIVTDATVVDCTGKWIFPGFIDMHVHFRDPGNTHKETLITGGVAAVSGGVTTVFDMPNTSPATISQERLDAKREIAKEAPVRVEIFIGTNGKNLDELRMVEGACGIKVYMGSSTGDLLLTKEEIHPLTEVFEIAAERNMLVAVHAEDEVCLLKAAEEIGKTDDPADHSRRRPPQCAAIAVKAAIDLARKTGARLQICHLSTAAEVELVRAAKVEGLPVTAEAAPHHLFLNTDAYAHYGNLVKMNPPVREESDRAAVFAALADGTIDVVATDHAPHTLEEKSSANPPSGVPGIEDSFHLLFTAYHEGRISLSRLLSAMSTLPARISGFSDRGEIAEGNLADLVIVEPNIEWIRDEKAVSKCGWTLWKGKKMKGRVEATYVGGVKKF